MVVFSSNEGERLLPKMIISPREDDIFTLCRLEQSPETCMLPHIYNSDACYRCFFLAGGFEGFSL